MQAEPRVRRDVLVGAGIFLLACAVRFAYVASIADEPAVRYPVLDARAYHEWALAILDGDWLGSRVYYQDPLYPFFLAGLYAVFGPGSLGVLLAQCVLDAASVTILAATTRRLFDPPAALLAGFLASFYGVSVFYAALLLKAPLLIFVFTVAIHLLVRAAQVDRLAVWLAAGIALGVAALIRANVLLFAPVLALWLAFDRERPAVRRAVILSLATGGTLLVLMPVALRNYVVGGDFVLINSQGGQNFYIGNFRGNDSGVYRAPRFLRAEPRYEEEDFARVALEATGRDMSPSEVSRYWLERGLQEIGADPAHFVRHLLRKALVLVNHYEVPDNYSFPFTRAEIAPLLRLPLPSWGALLPLAFCGAAFARRRRPALLVLAFALSYAAGILLFFNLSRLRLPLVPFLIPFAAHGAIEIGRRLRRRELRGAAPALAFLVIAYPVVFADVVREQPVIRHYNLGMAHQSRGRAHRDRAAELSAAGREDAAAEALALANSERDRAEAQFRSGLALAPGHRATNRALLRLSLVRIIELGRLGRHAQALERAEALAASYPGDADTQAHLGAAYANVGRKREARAALRRALEIDASHPLARRELRRLRVRDGAGSPGP